MKTGRPNVPRTNDQSAVVLIRDDVVGVLDGTDDTIGPAELAAPRAVRRVEIVAREIGQTSRVRVAKPQDDAGDLRKALN